MKYYAIAFILALLLLPSVCLANKSHAKQLTIGLELSAFSYGQIADEGDFSGGTINETNFKLGNLSGGFTLGYTLNDLIEIGGRIGVAHNKVTRSDGSYDYSYTVKSFNLAPYLQFNFWLSEKIVLPLGLYIGYEGEYYSEGSIHYGIFAVKPAIEFFIGDRFSIGPSCTLSYTVGGVHYDDSSYDTQSIYKWKFAVAVDMTIWI